MKYFKSPRLFQLYYPELKWGFSFQHHEIVLTFDDGPNPQTTPWILEQLRVADKKAIFFCVGENVEKYPALYQQIIAEGHQVGNHTMKHENGWKTKNEDYLKSVENAGLLINSNLFRPPYGRIRKKQIKAIKEKGYEIMMWTWLTYDFDQNVPVEKIIQKIKKIKKGDIVVMHDNPKCFDRLKVVLTAFLQSTCVYKAEPLNMVHHT